MSELHRWSGEVAVGDVGELAPVGADPGGNEGAAAALPEAVEGVPEDAMGGSGIEAVVVVG